MLSSLKNCLISFQKSPKTLVHHLKILKKVMKIRKKSKPRRTFSGFNGMKSSFASMELSGQLELVFKFIDANGDGKISPLELSDFLLCLGLDKSKVAEEAAGMLRYLDSNGDGFIDLNEYMDVVMMDDDDGIHDHVDVVDDDDGYHHVDFEDDLRDAFLVFDSDKNGLISAKELHRVLKRLDFANCSLKECNLMIKCVDKDGDGFVNFEEFKLMMMGYHT